MTDENILADLNDRIIKRLGFYMDFAEDDKRTVALWIIAANFKNSFLTFPFLYINASKGSGKTRLLKLVQSMIPKSVLTPNLTEASLIRLPSQENLNALLIDEAERLTAKEKSDLRELMNQAYKRGGCVLRVQEDPKTKEKKVVRFPIFMGITLANIWGLESILEDRCISIILEKSKDPHITKIPEFYELDADISSIADWFSNNDSRLDKLISGMMEYFYLYLVNKHTLLTLPTLLTQPPLPTLLTDKRLEDLPYDPDIFCKIIEESDLMGRDLEIWLPLLIISYFISEDYLKEMLKLALAKSKEKAEMGIMEDRDTIFATFLYYYIRANEINSMVAVMTLQKKFFEDEGEKEWLSTEWIGRFLRRIKVIQDKRRLSKGIEVIINFIKLEDFLKKRGIEITKDMLLEYRDQKEEAKTLRDYSVGSA